MIRAVPQFGDLCGMGLADEIFIGIWMLGWFEDVIEPGTPKAGGFETEELGELGDEIGEEGVEEEEDDESPFKSCVDKNYSDFVGVSMQHGGEFVGRH